MKLQNKFFITGVLLVLLWGGLATAQPAAPAATFTEEEILARFSHEPIVQDVQDAAVRYYMVHPDYIQSMRKRALLKALVPQISGEFNNITTDQNRVMHDGLYPLFPFKEDEGINSDATGFRVGAVWTLDRLVFNAEILDVQSLIGILDGVVREVTTIYYIRRRLQIDMILRPPPDLATRISQRIRVEELTGLLDAMTGAFMSRRVREGLEKRQAEMGGGGWTDQPSVEPTPTTYQRSSSGDMSDFSSNRIRRP